MSAQEQTIDRADADSFRQHGYLVVPRLIEPALARFFWSYVHTKFASLLLGPGGPVAPDSLGGYGDPAFDGLLEFLRPRIEACCGLLLHPTYSVFRLYRHGNELRQHRDRPACEISVSLNIDQMPAEPWPLYVQGHSGPFAARLMPGDALLYRGIDLAHWREAYAGRELVQAFLHYVDRDGPHAEQKFDRRQTLMRRPATPDRSALGARE
jgi:hypothetical protein